MLKSSPIPLPFLETRCYFFCLRLLAKNFGHLEWNYVFSPALSRKGLQGHFIYHLCIHLYVVFSTIVNGQAFVGFWSSRGITQGYPLCPYLFVLATNELSLALQEAMENNNLAVISLGPNLPSNYSFLLLTTWLSMAILLCLRLLKCLILHIQHFCRDFG